MQSELTNIPNCVSLGRAVGWWVITVGIDQHLTTASPQVARAVSRYYCAIDQHSHFCLHCDPSQCRHPPQKGMRGFGVPGHATHEKTVHVPVSFAPLSLTCLDSFPDPYFRPPTTTESPLSTKVFTHSGSGIQGNRTTRHRMPPGRTNKPNPQDTS